MFHKVLPRLNASMKTVDDDEITAVMQSR